MERGGPRALLRLVATSILPPSVYASIMRSWRWGQRHTHPVQWGSLRRQSPVSWFGYSRGLPVDRHYIEQFLRAHCSDIRGRVLEIESNDYTRRFGGDRVTRSDVLYPIPGNPRATLLANLETGANLPRDTFDCLVVTQTLQFIYDVHAAVRHSYAALKPGGVMLATLPGITPISEPDMERWGEYWHFTHRSAQMVFDEAFQPGNTSIRVYGNLIAATAFLHGLATEDLQPAELAYEDPQYAVIIAVRAVRAAPR